MIVGSLYYVATFVLTLAMVFVHMAVTWFLWMYHSILHIITLPFAKEGSVGLLFPRSIGSIVSVESIGSIGSIGSPESKESIGSLKSLVSASFEPLSKWMPPSTLCQVISLIIFITLITLITLIALRAATLAISPAIFKGGDFERERKRDFEREPLKNRKKSSWSSSWSSSWESKGLWWGLWRPVWRGIAFVRTLGLSTLMDLQTLTHNPTRRNTHNAMPTFTISFGGLFGDCRGGSVTSKAIEQNTPHEEVVAL
ncbi:hypothetical protein AAMO2058_001545000 [Amorphochlora amoebiformis]